MRYTRLTNLVQRRVFNPADKKDLIEFKFFLKHNTWKTNCPFYLEDPWEDIPSMCKHKYTVHMLSKA